MADSPRCGFCREEINPGAKVCRHCSRSQNRWINLLRSSDVIASAISVAVLIVTIWQLNEAKDTNVKAYQALEKASATETQVLEVYGAVLKVAECIIPIAEILPRTGGYGGCIGKPDKEILRKNLDCLKNLPNLPSKSKR